MTPPSHPNYLRVTLIAISRLFGNLLTSRLFKKKKKSRRYRPTGVESSS